MGDVMDPVWAKFSEYGLVGLVIAALFFIVWKMLCWVMTFIKDTQKQQCQERETWLLTIQHQNDVLNKISSNIDEHDKRAEERGRFVRDEHKEMIQILGRINGYKHD